MTFVDEQGRATRAQRWPCTTTWESTGCGEVLRLDEAFEHILDHHPDAGPQARVLAALAELSTTVGVAAGTQFYEWVLQLRDLTDWTPGVRSVLYGLSTIADGCDPLAEALAECTDVDRQQLTMLLDIRGAQHKGERFWGQLAHIIDPSRQRP